MKTGLAITTTILRRHRVGLLAVAACYCASLPILYVHSLAHFNDVLRIVLAIAFTIPLLVVPFGALYLIAVFTNPDSDVASPRSTYPSHYFTLPVRSFELALWPMAVGCSLLAGATALFVFVINRRFGGSTSLVEMALVGAAFMAMFQAIFWFPFGLRYSKLVLTFLAVILLTLVMLSESLVGVGRAGREGIYAAVILLSFIGAIVGLGRARTGPSRQSKVAYREGEAPSRRAKAIKFRKPFRSPEAAQFWYEWRRQGILLPVVTAVLIVLFLIPQFFDSTLEPIPGVQPKLGLLPSGPAYLLTYFPVLIVAIFVASWAIGGGAKRTDVKREGDRSFHLTFATRPMTDVGMAVQKFKAAAFGSLVSCVLILVLLVGIMFCPSKMYDVGDQSYVGNVHPLFQNLMLYLTPAFWVDVGCFLLIVVALSVRNSVAGIWAELSEVRGWSATCAIASLTGFLIWAFVRQWLVPVNVYFVVGVLLAAKFGALGFVIFHQWRRGILRPRFLGIVLGLFCITCVALEAAVRWLARGAVLPSPITEGMAEFQMIPFLVVFWVPIVRILLAPEMLYLNRHRG